MKADKTPAKSKPAVKNEQEKVAEPAKEPVEKRATRGKADPPKPVEAPVKPVAPDAK